MNKLKLNLITYLRKTFKSNVRPAKTGNGINVFADITQSLAKIEQMAEACELSVIVTPKRTNQFTGEVQPAKAWIGSREDNATDDDFLSVI
jgi:dihydropteroate synthase